MSVADRLNKLTTDITNAYTSIENKGGTIPANKNTENMSTAINSIEVIESATAEGESISLANTKAMPYSDYAVKGKSEQETRSGKNLFDRDKVNVNGSTITLNDTGITISNNWANTLMTSENVIKDLKPNTDYICTAKVTLTELPSNIYEISNYYTLLNIYNQEVGNTIILRCETLEEKNNWQLNEVKELETSFTTPSDMSNYRILSYNYYGGPSVNGTGTFKIEELMIREKNVLDNSFELYGSSPSPEYPSEIHSVADDVNLFDASKIQQSSIVVTDNGKTIELPIISSGNGNINTNTFLKDLCPELNVGDVVYLNFTRNINPGKNNFIFLYNNTMSPPAVEWDNGTSKTIDQNLLDSYVILYGNKAQDGETQQIILTNFKIQKGTVVTPYSPYNQGTVTIKQRGKNLANNNFEEWTTDDAYAYIPITLEQGKTYILSATRVGELKTLYYNFGIVKDGTKYSDFVLLRTCIDYTTGDTSTVTFTVDNTYTNPKLVAYVDRSQSKFNELFANYNIQLEERNTGYLLRTISNTTRLHYPNRTIT